MQQDEYSHLLQSILDQLVSGGSPGRGAGSTMCRDSAPSPWHCPQAVQGQAFPNPYGKYPQASQGLPWLQQPAWASIWPHKGSSGTICVTFPATRAEPPICGCPGHQHCFCPSCSVRRILPSRLRPLGGMQGWRWDGTGGGGKVWNLPPHPGGCPGALLPEQGEGLISLLVTGGGASGAALEFSLQSTHW